MLDIFIMNMGGHDDNVVKLTTQFPHAKIIRWTTHDNCMRKAAQMSRTNGFWLIASCCDYTGFDFDWRPVPWESELIHCWASGKQEQGDTFWMPKQIAQYKGMVDIDYRQVEDQVTSILDADGDGELTSKDAIIWWRKLKGILTQHLPSTSGFSAGFAMGIYYG